MTENGRGYLSEIEELSVAEQHLLLMVEVCEKRAQAQLRLASEVIFVVYHKKACYGPGSKYAQTYLDLTLRDQNATQNEVANAFSNLGLNMTGLFRLTDSLDFLDKALECTSKETSDRKSSFNMDRFYRNRGRALFYLGRNAEALADYATAEQWQDRLYGPNSIYLGE